MGWVAAMDVFFLPTQYFIITAWTHIRRSDSKTPAV